MTPEVSERQYGGRRKQAGQGGMNGVKRMRYEEIDLARVRTQSAYGRVNLVRADMLRTPGEDIGAWDAEGFDELADRIVAAVRHGRPVIWSQGAHVIKCGLSRYLIRLMERGFIRHLAGNGACSIHDFELAFLGGTSEHVPTAIEDGSFGMWEETGRWMNEALNEGAAKGWGYGEALARYIDAAPERFPFRDDCVLYRAYQLGVPATYHIALGTDIIHQHPLCDFAAVGKTSQTDFRRLCRSVSQLDGGVFLNFGSSVIGPEVFLKALSIARNLGYPTFSITTADFDLRPACDGSAGAGPDGPDYYYRPLKNIVQRPVSRGGRGWRFTGDHRSTVPALYGKLMRKAGIAP